MSRPPPGTVLCRIDEIPEPGAKGFNFGSGRDLYALFAIRYGGKLRLYRNECPHARTPLDFPEGRFFTADGAEILCGTHGARFVPESGFCVSGPCRGQSLIPLPVSLQDGLIILD